MSLRLISATRQDADTFRTHTLLGRSLQHSAHKELLHSVAFNNTKGLPEIYNAALDLYQESVLLFCHDDLALPPTHLEPLLQKALNRFDIVGLAGNRRDLNHFAWHVRPDGLGWDYPYLRGETLSGSTTNTIRNIRGLCDVPVALIDGAFIAIQRNRLVDKRIRFDERFLFHFYDLDLCRQARECELQLGVIRLDCVHTSGGLFGDPDWIKQAKLYCAKWSNPYPQEAIACFEKSTNPNINAPPGGPPAFAQGRQAYRKGAWVIAQQKFQEVLQIEPNHPWSWLQLANCQRRLGETTQAIESLRELCRRHPRRVDGWKNLGLLLQQQGKPIEARECLERMVALAPTDANNLCTLADVLTQMGARDDAESLLCAAAHGFGQNQHGGQLWLRLGILLEQRGETHRAIKALHNAALLVPNDPTIQLPRVGLLLSIGQPEAALASVNELLEQHPGHIDAVQRKAEILQFMGQNEESLALCQQARQQDPRCIDLQLLELYASQALCDWSQRDAQLTALQTTLRQRPSPKEQQPHKLKALPPFGLLTLPLPDDLVIREIDRWVLNHQPTANAKAKLFPRGTPAMHNGNGRLRIGYLSADFRTHAMGLLLEGLFEAHDPEQAETFAYSISPIRDALTEHYRSSADHFHDLSKTNDHKALHQIAADDLDVLVDLSGLTAFSRPAILVCQPAPMQLGYLGFPGSQGHHFVDVIVADRQLIPAKQEDTYPETVWCLPHAWSTRYRQPMPGITRSNLGLPETGTIFCCFNRAEKITPAIAEIWMEILREVPSSWLWLALNPAALDRLKQLATQKGVTPDRLLPAPYQRPVERFIGAMACADLFLDTPDFNAGAVGALALNAGLPLLTCAGQTFKARMGASLCNAANIQELVTSDLISYKQRAIELGQNPENLQQIKNKLKHKAIDLPLFQQQQWVYNLCNLIRIKS